MRRTAGWLAVVAVMAGVLAPVTVVAQADDDWEFAEDAARDLTVAVAEYSAGKSIIAQCAGEELKVVLIGLPATTETARRLDATRSDGATDTQVWEVGEGQLLISTMPARDARFLRTGGELRLRSAAGQASSITASFDLPMQHANLDRVLTACGYSHENDRDAVPRADPALQPQRVSEGSMGGKPGRSQEVSCIVQAGALRECRTEHMLSGQTNSTARREANRWNGRRLNPEDAAANEGRLAYIYVPLLQVVYR